MADVRIPGSFRDPSGFLYVRDGTLYRQVNSSYREDYDCLIQSGLHRILVEEGRLIAHEEVERSHCYTPEAYKVLRPRLVPFVSYPHEWCFSQLKDASLLTLAIQKAAVERGMSLKDCSAYNVQFVEGRPVLIDTLSFERLREGKPWIAYRQFCQHFLAPLALMRYRDVRLNQLFRVHMDGIPLDLAASLLPWRTRLRVPLLLHLHLHARAQKRFAEHTLNSRGKTFGRNALLGLMDSLEGAIRHMEWNPRGTEWGDYYEATNYSAQAVESKKKLVEKFLDQVRPKTVWDLGGNTGVFSRLASARGIATISLDADPAAVEKNYLRCVAQGEKNLLPLVQDLANPSSGLGWANEERQSLLGRGSADAVLALALVHHLSFGHNLPFLHIARLLGRLCRDLLIEFVPKHDSQVQRLLRNREDVFKDYDQRNFEEEFQRVFVMIGSEKIADSERVLYHMQRKH